MAEKYFATLAKRRESSLARYAIRAKKDSCLHDDVEAFMAKHETSLENLLIKLLADRFVLDRYTDSSYPM